LDSSLTLCGNQTTGVPYRAFIFLWAAKSFAHIFIASQNFKDTKRQETTTMKTTPNQSDETTAPLVVHHQPYDNDQVVVTVQEISQDESPFAKKCRRRHRRRWRMVAGGTAGAILGTLIFCGPLGVVAGAAAGAGAARVLSKRGERKKDTYVCANDGLSPAVIN
jgi:hypothetical protein